MLIQPKSHPEKKLSRWKAVCSCSTGSVAASFPIAGVTVSNSARIRFHHVIRVKSGYKAEEDLLLSCGWENGSEIPKGVRVFCTIGCYEQGGAYLGANLLWDDEEQKNVITSPFSTTKP